MISNFAARLSSDNPLDILKRGFAKITDHENRNITSVEQVNTGDLIKIDIADGTMKAEIKEKKHGKTDI
jgi:exodeoxyribonuclease VII large subunit